MSRKKTGRVLAEPQQVAEILSMVTGKLGKGLKTLDFETARYWAGHANDQKLKEKIEELIAVLLQDLADPRLITDWLQFYREVFHLELDPADITLPSEQDGFGWIVVVAKDLTCNGVFEICRQRFNGKVWRHCDDLDQAITHNDRQPTQTYAIRVRDRVGADVEHKDRSANATAQQGIKGMTNLERMLLELWYHWKNKDHLDTETLTICSGSRYTGGYVPYVRWGDDEFSVGYVHPDSADGNWRVREVVSLPACR